MVQKHNAEQRIRLAYSGKCQILNEQDFPKQSTPKSDINLIAWEDSKWILIEEVQLNERKKIKKKEAHSSTIWW